MKTVIIGSGNVAWHMAKAMVAAQIDVIGIFGRNITELQKISQNTGISYFTDLIPEADFYLICVADDAIAEVSKAIKSQSAIVAHTSGSVSRETLNTNTRKSVIYPLQTFSKTKQIDYSEIPFFIDANDSDFEVLKEIFSKISAKIERVDNQRRKMIHISAVFSCNFVNHLYARAQELCSAFNIDFKYFVPLINETTEKMSQLSPKEAQTGPARRNDQRVLEDHKKLLSGEHRKLYETISDSILKMYEL